METRSESNSPRASVSKRMLLVIFAVGLVLLLAFYAGLRDPRCAILLARSLNEQLLRLPSNCVQTTEVQTDAMASYLESERRKRGLTFDAWIICKSSPETGGTTFAFLSDPHWLPTYVPGTYQFRRTVIIVPYGSPIPQGSPIAAEVAVVPWRRYVSQVSGECDGKFSIWK